MADTIVTYARFLETRHHRQQLVAVPASDETPPRREPHPSQSATVDREPAGDAAKGARPVVGPPRSDESGDSLNGGDDVDGSNRVGRERRRAAAVVEQACPTGDDQ